VTGLWRWRRNPLRRGSDVAEALVALAAALLIAVGTPLCGLLVGSSVHSSMARVVAEQHQQRTLVTATVIRTMPHPPVDPDPETSTERDAHRPVVAGWSAPDGTQKSGVVRVARDHAPGSHFRTWIDADGNVVPRPLDESTAATQATLAGVGAGAVTAGLVEGARRLLVWRMVNRRYARWDRAWEAAGRDWGRTGTGS
jgi:F0F1-type ATP synthase membrane subunit c/vacuolar-type H+-ATPase subunit K